MKKTYLFLLTLLIISCSGVPKNNEQLAESNEQASTDSVIATGDEQSEESSELAEVDAEEEPVVGYVEAFELDEPQEIAEEPELQPTEIVMETLRPVAETPPMKPDGAPPALPERQIAPIVPPVRESRPPALAASPKETTTAIAQEPPLVVNEQPGERILQPDYPITFSRVARVTVGQVVEIPFRGKDWVFLGEVGARRGIAYDSRKLDPEGESFIFRVEASGTYALKFYRQDFVRDLILNDHVQIIAGGASETTGLGWFNPPIDRSRVVAGPRWPNFLEPINESRAEQQLLVEEKEIAPESQRDLPTTETKPSQPPTAAQPPATAQPPAAAQSPVAPQPSAVQPSRPATTPAAVQAPAQPSSPLASKETPTPVPAPEPVSPDSILKQARDEFNAGRIASAITLLDQFCKSFPSGSDEAWWLYGQCFEANSPNRNMLSALDYYRRLIREYPQSSRINDARRRISYLERYYINIQ